MIDVLRYGTNSCYLVTGDEGRSVLVDTGLESNREALLEDVKDKHVSLIVLTHGHNDHIANAQYLADKLGVPVAMHEDDYEITFDNTIRDLESDNAIGTIVQVFTERVNQESEADPLELVLFLKDGESLSRFGIDAKVVALKGHTKGSIGILVGGSDFIVGDAMMNMLMPSRARLYEDKEAMLSSIEIIKDSGATTIYTGHGKPIDASKFFKRDR